MHRIAVESFGITDRGIVRPENQDQFFVAELTRNMQTLATSLDLGEQSLLQGAPLGHLFMVADGMGGHRAGDEASKLAIEFFIASILNRLRWLSPQTDLDEELLVEDLQSILSQSHREIKRQAEQSVTLAGMGTTFTMAYLIWPRLFIVHAGDTRCYLCRNGQLQILTHDHTVAEQMMKMGQLTPETLERSPWANVLINALGAGADEVFAEIATVLLEEQDLLLLCSDGLNKHVDDRGILEAIQRHPSPEALCRALVARVNADGGTDNVTIIAAKMGLAQTNRTMPIFHATAGPSHLLREIVGPIEDVDTSEMDLGNPLTEDFKEPPTEPLA